MDGWTSPNMRDFLGITVHWQIGKDWRMRSLFLDIAPLSGPHTGENLCSVFLAICNDFEVMDKLLTITTGSASNDTPAAHLEAACRS
jgi:hypothetical protein